MLELILSDITVMGPGYCVIGLERLASGAYRSIRPMPPWGFAWRDPFSWQRGDCVGFSFRPISVARPHVEDVRSSGLNGRGWALGQEELVNCLRKAEVSSDLEHLFGCSVKASTGGGRALWASPAEAARSICGCEYLNLRFRLFPEPKGFNLRAEMTLASNERLSSLPVVDRAWRSFANQVFQRIQRSDALAFAERFLNTRIRQALSVSTQHFARIGLPRPRADQQCWLMLDSLFPQPAESWLDLL